jgi:hypothetical protein
MPAIGTPRRFAAVLKFGSDRGTADIPQASRARLFYVNGPNPAIGRPTLTAFQRRYSTVTAVVSLDCVWRSLRLRGGPHATARFH